MATVVVINGVICNEEQAKLKRGIVTVTRPDLVFSDGRILIADNPVVYESRGYNGAHRAPISYYRAINVLVSGLIDDQSL